MMAFYLGVEEKEFILNNTKHQVHIGPSSNLNFENNQVVITPDNNILTDLNKNYIILKKEEK